MRKETRAKIKSKFGGYCAYCGKPLGGRFHIDHVVPILRGVRRNHSSPWGEVPESVKKLLNDDAEKALDVEENMYPSCPRCNLYKSSMSVEQFREEIGKQADRLRRDSRAFRLAEDFGAVSDTNDSVVFWFERFNESTP